ncbi:MAG TPA: hypothetical protein DCM08_12870 [Microscillaceae bacterium]|jgi:polyisoprenoid-binding protein YceI|nr:hypothetical protein [Microscillaceae bacterium]
MATYQIDPLHSEILFKVKHLMISTVTGNFTQFNAQMDSQTEDFSDAKISFEADINSISTNNEQRDGHLKSPDFFDAANHPKLTFVSSKFTPAGNQKYTLEGTLTIRGNSQPITLAVNYGGTMVDGYGQTKVGFEAEGKLSRKSFGLTWDAVTEAGGVVVADEVKLLLNIQLTKQA